MHKMRSEDGNDGHSGDNGHNDHNDQHLDRQEYETDKTVETDGTIKLAHFIAADDSFNGGSGNNGSVAISDLTVEATPEATPINLQSARPEPELNEVKELLVPKVLPADRHPAAVYLARLSTWLGWLPARGVPWPPPSMLWRGCSHRTGAICRPSTGARCGTSTPQP